MLIRKIIQILFFLFFLMLSNAFAQPAAQNKFIAGSGADCGGPQQIECEKGHFCQFKFGSCGQNQDVGVCKPAPEVCAQIFMPVCGCDNKTYPNACVAAAEKKSVRGNGDCPK